MARLSEADRRAAYAVYAELGEWLLGEKGEEPNALKARLRNLSAGTKEAVRQVAESMRIAAGGGQ